MTARVVDESGGALSRPAEIWLWLSFPIGVIAIVTSLAGILLDAPYTRETTNWAGQAVGQDIANLVAYPVLLILAVAARRGSLRAFLAWTGVIAYSVYTFAIYAFTIHFGRLFLAYVAVFGLSVFALIGGLTSLNPKGVKARFTPSSPVRFTAGLLIGIGAVFYLLWLSEVIPATIENAAPQATRQAGLLTNPVHVLDMGVLLPAALVAGVLLVRRRPWGYCLAPTLLGCFALLSIGIVAAMAVLGARGEDAPIGVTVAVAILTIVELVTLVRFLGRLGDSRSETVAPAPSELS